MPQAPGYGSIGSPAAEEGAAGAAVTPILPADESDRLVDLYDDERRVGRRWRGLAPRRAALVALGAAAAVLGLAYTAQPSSSGAPSLVEVSPSASAATTTTTTTTTTPAVEEELAPLSFEATNFYHVRDGKPGLDYPFLKDVKLIEPHRETTLSISSPRDGHDYLWKVRGVEAEDLRATARGAEAVVVLTELEENTITVTEVDAAGVAVRQLEETVMVKYVRREIRTLTDDEREELFDAVRPMVLLYLVVPCGHLYY